MIEQHCKALVDKNEGMLCLYHLHKTFCQDQGWQSWQPPVVCRSTSNLSSGAGRETEDNWCLQLRQVQQKSCSD